MRYEYTDAEQQLINEVSYMKEVPSHQLENAAESLESNGSLWVAVELGRCPSTDRRTYILHTSIDKPRFDYYGAELIKFKDR